MEAQYALLTMMVLLSVVIGALAGLKSDRFSIAGRVVKWTVLTCSVLFFAGSVAMGSASRTSSMTAKFLTIGLLSLCFAGSFFISRTLSGRRTPS